MKTSELTDIFLDWAVTKAEGLSHDFEEPTSIWGCHGWATSWEMGGPIIEREAIETAIYSDQWQATMHLDNGSIYERGPTPLIAAMRCYVASKLGDEVDIPDQLMGVTA